MPDRNPRIDPRPGDELRGDPWRYRVVWRKKEVVRYEMIGALGAMAWHSVSLSGWRDMAAGLIVERVA